MIKVALGSENFLFVRLLEWVDQAIDDGAIPNDEEIIVQYGCTKYTPRNKNMTMVSIFPYQEQMEGFKAARMSITHAGIGNLLDFVDIKRVPILVPRDPMRKEVVDGHQLDFCKMAKEELGLPVAFTYAQFIEELKEYNTNMTFPSFRSQLVDYLVSVIEN